MVHKCIVPFCKGNYKTGPKVATFGFPTDEELKQKWILAIGRKDYVPTRHSRVCEKHFNEIDIQRESQMLDPSNGKLVSAKLKIPRLKKGTVPIKIPSAPSHMSKDRNRLRRICPAIKKDILECHQLTTATSESLESNGLEDEKDLFTSPIELLQKIKMHLSDKWYIYRETNSITLAMITKNPAPTISHSVVISDDFRMQAFIASHELKKIGNYVFPLTCNSVKVLFEILSSLERMDENHAVSNEILFDHYYFILPSTSSNC